MPLGVALTTFLKIESRRAMLWAPVLLGTGIWIYFGQESEPKVNTGLYWAPVLLLLAVGWRIGLWFRVAMIGVLLVTVGYGLALWSAHRADAPKIRFPVGETVEGRVLEISRSASGAPRLLLDRLVVYGMEPDRTPERVRLTVLDGNHAEMPVPGTRVRTYATLMPNGEPVEPGAFDFRRRAHFDRMGGVGLVRGAVLVLPAVDRTHPSDRAFIWIQHQRDRISRALREALPGRQGAFAAAIIVGDRGGIEEVDAEALRASNLAHLLAISGLHMGILTGLIFALARWAFSLSPWFSLQFSTKKAAALVALAVGASYLALSGATIATQRAFIMVAVALLAVLADRPALTLRALALAAMIVLILRPVSLLDAGFQMSFAATAALVSGFEFLRKRRLGEQMLGTMRSGGWSARLLRGVALYVGGLIASSILAGLATAPFAAYHFNRTAPYGLLSNLLALPVMGFLIAPMACLAAALAPFGLQLSALEAMGLGIEQILRTAHWVSSLPGATRMVQEAPDLVLPLMCLGGLWLLVWRGPWRLAGIFAIVGSLWIWTSPQPRPDILIAADARLIGVLGPEGRVLDHHSAQSFAAKSWLRRDGDAARQELAAARPGLARTDRAFEITRNGWKVHAVWDRGIHPDAMADICQSNTVLITRYAPSVEGPCLSIGADSLDRSGAMAVWITETGRRIEQVRDPERERLWTRQ